jgi:hypothetical protein
MNSIFFLFLAAIVSSIHGFSITHSFARVRNTLVMKSDMTPISPQEQTRKALAAAGPALAVIIGAQVALAAEKSYLTKPTDEFVDGKWNEIFCSNEDTSLHRSNCAK